MRGQDCEEQNLMMKRLLVIVNSLGTGGAEKLLVNTLPLMKNFNFDIHVVVLTNNVSHTSYLEIFRNNGIPVTDLGLKSVYNPSSIFQLAKIMRIGAYDCIHAHLFPTSYWVAIAHRISRTKAKLFFTEHSNDNKRRNKSIYRPLERWIYKTYEKIIAITQEVQQGLTTWLGKEYESKIICIHNGVDVEVMSNTVPYEKSVLQYEFQLPSNACTILMAASFRYPKRQDLLIEALAVLPDHYYLLLAGEGELMDACKVKSQSLLLEDRVKFLGFRDDVNKLMKTVDINILNSDYEGMSGVTLESLAAGRPFLGSEVNGIKDIVPSNEYTFHDKASLIAKIMKHETNKEWSEKLTYQGITYANNFDLSIMVRKYIQVYNDKAKGLLS